jgi:hypothetical protein
LAAGRTICEHIWRFYSHVADDPPIFWRFISDILPEGCSLVQENSDRGDECHHNIIGLSDNRARKFFKKECDAFRDLLICTPDGTVRPLTREDL